MNKTIKMEDENNGLLSEILKARVLADIENNLANKQNIEGFLEERGFLNILFEKSNKPSELNLEFKVFQEVKLSSFNYHNDKDVDGKYKVYATWKLPLILIPADRARTLTHSGQIYKRINWTELRGSCKIEVINEDNNFRLISCKNTINNVLMERYK